MIASTFSTRSIEEIAAAASGPLWFQMYTYRGLDIPAQLVRRAEAAGYRAIVATVDAPQLGKRERDTRNNFKLKGVLTAEDAVAVAHTKIISPRAVCNASSICNKPMLQVG